MTQESKFIFSSHKWSPKEHKAEFSYQIQHNGEAFDFAERLSLPFSQPIADVPEKLLKNTLDNLLLSLGISYYKLFCPKNIILENITLSKEQADFWNTVYTKGLGEFFYKNEIDFRGLINFPFSIASARDSGRAPSSLARMTSTGKFTRQNRSLVGIGGGKDSIVAGEILKELTKDFSAFIVNDHPIKKQTTEVMGVDYLLIKRDIDPFLLELNKRPDAYNGHVPFSGMLAFISLFAALLYDYRYTVFGNEESANYGSVSYLGEEMNHQWGKSFEFEKLFQDYVKAFIVPDIICFSILRPYREIAVGRKFTQYPKYFPVFSSCNKNFRMIESTDKKWCGECPKCAFVFVVLAAFLPKEKIVSIFSQNLFSKASLLQIYKELLGVVNIKPFDCVGTPEEVKVAFYLSMQKGEYDGDVVMKFFNDEVLPKIDDIEALKEQVFALSRENRIPEEFLKAINSKNQITNHK